MRSLVAGSLVALALLTTGCGDDEKSARAPVNTTPETVPRNSVLARLPADVRRPFLENCIDTRGEENRSLCGCILVQLSRRTTPRELAQIAQSGTTPPLGAQRKLRNAAQVCLQQR